jgi:hypothetical protein
MTMITRRTPSLRDRCGRLRATLLGMALSSLVVGPADAEPMPQTTTVVSPPARRWNLVERVIAQDQGDWQVDYRLRLDATTGVVLTADDLGAAVDGWVSNSRVGVHAVPKRSNPKVAGSGTSAFDVIASPDEEKTCRERIVLRAWSAETPEPAARPRTTPATAPDPLAPVSIPPGGLLCVRVRLEHEHFLHGPYDPMLGVREVEFKLGPTVLRDLLALDREHYHAQAKVGWPVPPEDRRDTQHFVSAPDSLHLEAHVPGNQYYPFVAKPVRYDTKMRLSFWYLIAPGTEGEFRVRVAQYRDSPVGWQILRPGASQQTYDKVGRWTKVDRIIKTESEATSLALDFGLCGGEQIGEVWIDDVKLEALGAAAGGP